MQCFELLADLRFGYRIVFFLFEMGLPTNYDTLMSMKRDMFGLGLCQVILTTLSAGVIAGLCGL